MSLLFMSIAISVINAYIPKITNYVSSFFVKSPNTNTYKDEIKQLLAEIRSLNVRHDFPKYARLRRKLTKLTDDKRSEEKSYQAALTQVSSKVSYITHGSMTLISLCLFWGYKFHPVIRLPADWLYPVATALSWPIHSPGDISFPVWFLITNSVSKIISR